MSAIKSRLRYVICVCIAISTLIAALHITGYTRIPNALAYSCGDPSSGHCYGIASWTGSANGSGVDISINGLSCGSYCSSGFIDNEMWLEELNNNACPNGNCWVEAGYLRGVSGPVYFWADSRPNGTFNFHNVAGVPAGDYTHKTTFTIVQTATWNQWQVLIEDYVGNIWTNYSTNNGMTPNTIWIGMELAGPAGASAQRADFTNNLWHSSAGWNYQTNGSSWQGFSNLFPHNYPPPYGGVASTPNGSANHGGDIYTYCC